MTALDWARAYYEGSERVLEDDLEYHAQFDGGIAIANDSFVLMARPVLVCAEPRKIINIYHGWANYLCDGLHVHFFSGSIRDLLNLAESLKNRYKYVTFQRGARDKRLRIFRITKITKHIIN